MGVRFCPISDCRKPAQGGHHSQGAHFALPDMIRGFVPDAGALQRLPRRIPYNIAMELLLTGRRMGGDETARWGRVSQVVPSDKPMSTARELAEKIAEGAPLAVKALLEILPAIDPLPLIETFDKMKRGRSGLLAYEQMMISKDFLEGLRATPRSGNPCGNDAERDGFDPMASPTATVFDVTLCAQRAWLLFGTTRGAANRDALRVRRPIGHRPRVSHRR